MKCCCCWDVHLLHFNCTV
ncbi:hypothetical protein Nmel_015995, partial [Mimus melanotis]